MDTYLPGDQTERILLGETALKVWREFRGQSLDETAALVGIAPHVLKALEERELPLGAEVRDLLAAALNVQPAWIEREEYE